MNSVNQPSRTRTWLLLSVISLAAVFLAGFIPQYRKAGQLQDQLKEREQEVDRLQKAAKLSRARDLASMLYLEATRKNYGIAGQHATALFDIIGTLAAGTADPNLKNGLQELLAKRDAIVSELAQADAKADGDSRDILDRILQLTQK